MRTLPVLLAFLILWGCQGRNDRDPRGTGNSSVQGNIIIFHAGSLSVPFQKIARAFEKDYPGTKILLEAAGSVDCARKITDLHKPCDLMASSDYKIIRNFLIPEYTGWYLPFAGNEIVIAYTDRSKYGNDIDSSTWPDVLLRDDVRYGRSDPDADPCGYRTLMVMQLSGIYFGKEQLAEELALKDRKYIRPKEVDLLSMLELNETDYIFIYRSVAIQHGLKFLVLPDEINLKRIEKNEEYNNALVKIKGSEPGTELDIRGESIIYAITLLDDAPNPTAARAFLEFMLAPEKGLKILEETGHNSLVPLPYKKDYNLPEYLMKYQIIQ